MQNLIGGLANPKHYGIGNARLIGLRNFEFLPSEQNSTSTRTEQFSFLALPLEQLYLWLSLWTDKDLVWVGRTAGRDLEHQS